MFSSSIRPAPFALLALVSLGCAATPLNTTPVSFGVAASQSAPAAASVPTASIECSKAQGAVAAQPAMQEETGATMGFSMGDPFGAGSPPAVSSHGAPKSAAGSISVGIIRTMFEGRGIEGRAIPAPPARVSGEHQLSAPIGDESMVAPGSIAPEVIQRVVRQGLGQAEACYDYAQMRNPSLAGRVNVTFIIGGNGGVWSAKATEDSDLADPQVVSCIEQSFYLLSFPKPESGGMIAVTYPMVFRPNM